MKAWSFLFCGSLLTLDVSPAEEVLRIDGSNGLRPLIAELIQPFEESHPDIEVELGEGMKSTARFKALESGGIDIATASHGLEGDILAENDLTPLLFARMAVVFAVHSSIPLRDLTAEQLCSIYSGRVNNWSELGGPDLEIVRLVRTEDEVDTELVRASLPGMGDLEWAEDTQIFEQSGDLAELLDSTPGAIGLTSAIRAAAGENTNAIAIAGIPATDAHVVSGRYPLSRDSFFILPPEPSSAAEKFLLFVTSEEGAAVIRQNQALPVNIEFLK